MLQELDPSTQSLILVGPVLTSPLSLKKLTELQLERTPQIAIDGGMRFATREQTIAWMGDGDSSISSPDFIPTLFKKDQNLTDLEFSLQKIQAWTWTELHLFGFLGARKDHELANLGALNFALKERRWVGIQTQVTLYSDSSDPKIYFYSAEKLSIEILGSFSILTLEPAILSLRGACQFLAEKISLPPFSGRALSNQGQGKVEIKCSTPFLLIREGDLS